MRSVASQNHHKSRACHPKLSQHLLCTITLEGPAGAFSISLFLTALVYALNVFQWKAGISNSRNSELVKILNVQSTKYQNVMMTILCAHCWLTLSLRWNEWNLWADDIMLWCKIKSAIRYYEDLYYTELNNGSTGYSVKVLINVKIKPQI